MDKNVILALTQVSINFSFAQILSQDLCKCLVIVMVLGVPLMTVVVTMLEVVVVVVLMMLRDQCLPYQVLGLHHSREYDKRHH